MAGATGRLGARIVKMLLEKNNQIKVSPADAVSFLVTVKPLPTCLNSLGGLSRGFKPISVELTRRSI